MTTGQAASAFATSVGAAWMPSDDVLTRSRVLGLVRRQRLPDLPALHRHALDDPEQFWRAVIDDLDIEFARPFTRVLDESDGKPFPRWFSDGAINLTANCVDRFADGPNGEKPAIIWQSESGATGIMTYRQLRDEAARFAGYLRSIGVGVGDRVALFLPMIPQTAAAFFGCARIGAVVVPAFSGYGPDALATRLQESGAKVLVTADGAARKGGHIDMKTVADQAAERCPALRAVVVVRHTGAAPITEPRDVSWDDALLAGDSAASEPCQAFDPNHPVMIIYTSGTTGRPKGIVHSHGGFLVKAGHDFGYALDVQADDTVFWITDIGWLMGPLLMVGVLMFHATAVFYEGVPDHPEPGQVWRVVQRHHVSLLGISPTAVRNLAAAGDQWLDGHDLSSLRGFATTGEPWNDAPWWWLFDRVGGGRLPILNYSGGTEIGGGILTCYTILPIRPCAFSGPVIGMDVDVVDDQGRTLRNQVGELVIRNTWPGITHGFWHDPDRYLDTYWNRFPGTWVHGDLAVVDDSGYWYVAGRSDDTIKLAGKRVGPAEVESALVTHPAVEEAAAIGVPDERKGQALVCFVVLVPGVAAGPALRQEIIDSVVTRLGKTLAPHDILFVGGLPKTRNGKVVRRAIRSRYLGLPHGDLSSLDSADSLQLIPVNALDEAT